MQKQDQTKPTETNKKKNQIFNYETILTFEIQSFSLLLS